MAFVHCLADIQASIALVLNPASIKWLIDAYTCFWAINQWPHSSYNLTAILGIDFLAIYTALW